MIKMNKIKIEKGVLLISIIDAAIVSLAFILIGVYLNYDGYTSQFIYSCHVKTSFEFEIADENGIVYPAGTVFEVGHIIGDGKLAIYIEDDISNRVESDSDALAIEYGIDPYKHRVDPVRSLTIEDAQNSDELAKVFESLKNKVKKDFYRDCLITVAIGLVIFVVSLAVFVLINRALKNKPKAQYAVLLALTVICAVISFGSIMYLSGSL